MLHLHPVSSSELSRHGCTCLTHLRRPDSFSCGMDLREQSHLLGAVALFSSEIPVLRPSSDFCITEKVRKMLLYKRPGGGVRESWVGTRTFWKSEGMRKEET